MCLILLNQSGYAQDTLLTLPSIEVNALLLRTHPVADQTEHYHLTDQSPTRALTVADFLQRKGGIYLKHYGPGSIATPSMRGSSASQVAILWNGLPIQSPMLGLTDLSLLPDLFIDHLHVHYGSSGANFSNGALGGSLNMNNRLDQRSSWRGQFQSSIGSFGNQRYQAKIGYRNQRWMVQTRLTHQDALNDFTYRLRQDLPEKRQTNARVRQNALLQEIHWLPNSRIRYSAYVWIQSNTRQIPPTTVQTKSEASQDDAILRGMMEAEYKLGRHNLRLKTAHLREDIHFQDPQILIDALSGFTTWLTDFEHEWKGLHGITWHNGIRYQLTSAEADGYVSTASQRRFSVFSHLGKSWSTLKVQMGTQSEWVDGQLLPFQPDFRAQLQVYPGLSFSSKIARHYRLPTLNDIYWVPGGNDQLRPEAGWSQELSMSLDNLKYFTSRMTGWHRLIDDWIMWSPKQGSFLWQAQNITKVRSYGFEYRATLQHTFRNWQAKLETGFDLVRAYSMHNLASPKLEKGGQLPYTPQHQANIGLLVDYKSLQLHYTHRFTGMVSGQNEAIQPFDIGWLNLSYRYKTGPHSGILFFESSNIWNKPYRIVERRVMPGRTFEVGFRVNLNSQKMYE